MTGLVLVASLLIVPAILFRWQVGLLVYACVLPLEGWFVSGASLSLVKIATAALGVALAARLSFSAPLRNRLSEALSWPALALLGAFLFWASATLIWSGAKSASALKLLQLVALVFVVVSASLLDGRWRKRVIASLVLGSVFSVVLGLLGGDWGSSIGQGGRFSSAGLNQNDFAGLLAVSGTAFLFGETQRVSDKLLRGAAYALFAIAILASQSRGGAIALFAAPIVTAASLGVGRTLKRGAVPMAAFLLSVAMLVSVARWSDADAIDTVTGRYETLLDIEGPDTWAGRLDIWRTAVALWADRPITGVGLGAFPYESLRSGLLPAKIRDENLGQGAVAHNMFLSVLTETGLPGLALFFSAFLVVMLRLWRMARGGVLGARALFAAMLVAMLCSLTLSWETEKVLYLFIGLSGSLRRELATIRSTTEPCAP